MVELSSEKIVLITSLLSIGVVFLIFLICFAFYKYYKTYTTNQETLLKAVIETQESERMKIAQDMHDSFGNIFSTILLEVSSVRLIDDRTMRNARLDVLANNINDAKQELRYNVRNLAPGNLKGHEWLKELVYLRVVLERNQLEMDIETSGEVIRYPKSTETNLFRICQELVNNALKYSKCTKISFRIEFTPEHLEIHYEDNGVGFDVEMMKNKNSFGIKSIDARTQVLKGQNEVISNIGVGVNWQFIFEHKHLKELI